MDENLSEDEQKEKVALAKKEFEKNAEKYAAKYDENAFQKLVKKLSRKVSEPFVTLYYVMMHPDISAGEKALCFAAPGRHHSSRVRHGDTGITRPGHF